MPSDPIFDRPYEPPAAHADGAPVWEQRAAVVPPPHRASPNIRSTRKVAAWLGGSRG
jgi:hypothetical protein